MSASSTLISFKSNNISFSADTYSSTARYCALPGFAFDFTNVHVFFVISRCVHTCMRHSLFSIVSNHAPGSMNLLYSSLGGFQEDRLHGLITPFLSLHVVVSTVHSVVPTMWTPMRPVRSRHVSEMTQF